MPVKINISDNIIKAWFTLREQRLDLSGPEIANIVRNEFPESFGQHADGRIHDQQLGRYARANGHRIPPRRPGPIPKPRNRYREQVTPLTFPHVEAVILLSDLHSSAHQTLYVERAAQVIECLEIDTAVYMGDQLNNDYLGHRGVRSQLAAPLEENLEHFAHIANHFHRAGLQHKYAIQGNHDDKPMRRSDQELLYPEWWDAKIAPRLDGADTYQVTHQYECTMEPEITVGYPFPDGWRNFPWLFTHAQKYSTIKGRTPHNTANKRTANVVNGHEHHLLCLRHQGDVRRWACGAGTAQDPFLDYKVNREAGFPEWDPGFITIINNYPIAWHLDMPKAEWDRQLGLCRGAQ